MFRLTALLGLSMLLGACASMMPKSIQPDPQTLYFDIDSAALRPASLAYIDQLADFLNKHEHYDVVIEGFTDNTASSEYNLGLAQRRALAVQSRLAARGVSPARTTTAAYGEQRPVQENINQDGRQANRRVVVSTINRSQVAIKALRGGAPRYNYTSTDPLIPGTEYNSGIRPTHR